MTKKSFLLKHCAVNRDVAVHFEPVVCCDIICKMSENISVLHIVMYILMEIYFEWTEIKNTLGSNFLFNAKCVTIYQYTADQPM